MDRRGHESPMDFQYATGYGPTNPQSPFFSITPNRQTQGNFSNQAFGRPDSPPKSLFPSQQPVPALNQYRAPSFTTPRKPPESFDFSSGPENNQSSPDMADNDDTPPAKNNAPLMKFVGSKSEKRSLFNATPGRGAIARTHHDDRLSRKVHKRKRREYDRDNRITHRRPSHDYDSDSRPSSSDDPYKSSQPQRVGIIPSIFTFIHQHPDLPHILSWYTQYMLNLFAVLFIMYLAYSFWSTVRSDVDQASGKAAAETMAEMAVCAREYVENRCDGEYRVRALETVCENWARCMNQDPTLVGRAKVSARTFAEIFNSFIEPISYKAWIFCITMAISLLTVSNIAFSFFRHKVSPIPPASYMPPQNPVHLNPEQSFFTPYQNRMGMQDTSYQSRLEFQGVDHGNYGMRMRTPSPSKRIGCR